MTALPTVIATYLDAEAARRAVAMLSDAGVDGDAIALAGSAVVQPDSALELVRADRSMIRRIFWAGLIWGAAGAVLGALIGFALALLSFPTDNMAIQIASWAMFVHIAATLWAAYAVIDDGTPRTPRGQHSARALLVVRSMDPSLLGRAEALLRESAAAVHRA